MATVTRLTTTLMTDNNNDIWYYLLIDTGQQYLTNEVLSINYNQ